MRRLPTLSWVRETGKTPAGGREPDCLRSARQQMARFKRFQRLRGIALICLVALASGYLGTRIDPIRALADSVGKAEAGALPAPGYVVVLDEGREAAAAPPTEAASASVEVSLGCGLDGSRGTLGCGDDAPAWRSSLAPAEDAAAPSEPLAEPLALAMIVVPEIEPLRQASHAPALPVIRAPRGLVKERQAPAAARSQDADAAAKRGAAERGAAGTCGAGPETVAVKAFQTGSRTASFIVVGSYTDPMNALKAFSRVQDRWQAQIVHTEVGGRLYRRVLLGPFGREALAEVRRELAERGVEDTWAFRTSCVSAG